MTLREDILELLRKGPWTANGLCKELRRDKAGIRKMLLMMQRREIVICKPKK
jgi:DNA-binding IclR family transcriptional regulator